MAQRQCGKCGEDVDEAKAFCPGCGNAFVEEKKRSTATQFEASGETMQITDSMYNQMLTDMGLSISKAPNRGEKVIQTIPAEPVIPAPQPVHPEISARPGYAKWLIAAAVVVVGFALLVIVAAVIILFLFWPRTA